MYYFEMQHAEKKKKYRVIPHVQTTKVMDTAIFECLSWYPEHVTWTFERGPLPNNVLVNDSPGFHKLIIYAVEWNNAGTYTCKGNEGNISLFEDEGVLIVKGI